MIKSAKQILALLFLVFTLALNSISQGNMEDSGKETKQRKWQINFGIADFLAKNAPFELSDYTLVIFQDDNSFVRPVIGAKYLTKYGSVRTGLSFRNYNSESGPDLWGQNIYKSSRTWDLFLGYESYITFNRFKVYYGLDLVTGLQRELFENESDSVFISLDAYASYFGASPLIGLDYSLSRLFSISTEIKVNYRYYSGYFCRQYSDYPGATGKIEDTFNGSVLDIGPIGFISFNIHL